MEDILKKTLENKTLIRKVKELTAVWNDYSYTPSHYIEIYGENTENRGEKAGIPDISKRLVINSEGFCKLDYEVVPDYLPGLFEDESEDKLNFKSIKKLSPQEVVQEFPSLSGKRFQNYLAWALKRQERDNKLYQEYRIIPAETLSESLENMFFVGVNHLLEFVALPFSFLKGIYRKASQGQTENV